MLTTLLRYCFQQSRAEACSAACSLLVTSYNYICTKATSLRKATFLRVKTEFAFSYSEVKAVLPELFYHRIQV